MNASSWEQLTDQLATRLPRLTEDDVIILKASGNRYIQLIQRKDGLTLEAVSNRALPPEAQLNTGQAQELQDKGWRPPNPPLRMNWWQDVNQWPLHSRDATRIADLMVSTLRDVYEIAAADDVTERSFSA
ncbi:TY-Chap domain-containing protein [Krasilnikovia sp. MM14-A1259]|uniref:TY-Chap domain-containing protein n=1 Tax=Krasilnikovia sp. MM14-A1259 TaxID=3373539 RepID=UPI0038295DFB